jgi:hypothetical protein
MGEVTDDIRNGIMCQVCGVWMPDMFKGKRPNYKMWNNPPGHPRTCPDCQSENDLRNEEY